MKSGFALKVLQVGSGSKQATTEIYTDNVR